MPRYFFHVMDGHASVDRTGSNFDSIGDARAEAVRLAGSILNKEATSLVNGHPWQMTVVDTAGDTVFSLKFEADHHGY